MWPKNITCTEYTLRPCAFESGGTPETLMLPLPHLYKDFVELAFEADVVFYFQLAIVIVVANVAIMMTALESRKPPAIARSHTEQCIVTIVNNDCLLLISLVIRVALAVSAAASAVINAPIMSSGPYMSGVTQATALMNH